MSEKYEEHFNVSPGLFLRPRFSWDDSRGAAVFIGGKPQLPANLEWPNGLTFYAQIHLDRIERDFSVDGRSYHTQGLPETGTLFVFLPLGSDAAYDGPAKVLYTEDEVSDLPERDPPETLFDLRAEEKEHASYWLNVVGLSPCGRLLYRQYADFLPGLTFEWAMDWSDVEFDDETANRLFERMDEVRARAAHDALKRYPRTGQPPVEKKPERETRFATRIPPLNETRLTWPFIFEWCRQFQIASFDLGLKRLKPFLEIEEHSSSAAKIQALFESKRGTLEKAELSDAPKLSLRSLLGRRLPPNEGKFDKQAEKWMAFAQGRTDTVSKEQADAFIAMFDRLAAFKTEVGSFIELWAIDSWNVDHDLDTKVPKNLAGKALKMAEPLLNLGPEDTLPPSALIRQMSEHELKITDDPELIAAYWDSKLKSDLQSLAANRRPIPPQLLGLHDAREADRDELAETHVPLLQIRDSLGTQIENIDGIFELWIKPEALAAKDFSKVSYMHMFS